jgi:phytanoyl-CoA hydroxylase
MYRAALVGCGPRSINHSDHVRWSVDLRYQPTDQDPMAHKGIGFLARSRLHPERVATLVDWLAQRPEHLVVTRG